MKRLGELGIAVESKNGVEIPCFTDTRDGVLQFGRGGVIMARHGKTHANESGLFQGGDRDTPLNQLSAEGIAEARVLGASLRAFIRSDFLLVSGPRHRAVTTAHIVAEVLGATPIASSSLAEFNEMRAGDWFNTDYKKRIKDGDVVLRRLAGGDFFTANRGECGAEVLLRVYRGLQKVAATQMEREAELGRPVDLIIVTHTVVCQMARILQRDQRALAWTDVDLPTGGYFSLSPLQTHCTR